MDNNEFYFPEQNVNKKESCEKEVMFPRDAVHKDEKFLYVNNGGRRLDEPDLIAKRILFWTLKDSGFTRQEIIIEMEISTRSYSRYVESMERTYRYCERLGVLPKSINKHTYFNKYQLMAEYLKMVLGSEKADIISEEWKAKAQEKIKSFEKLAAMEKKDVYKMFNGGMFDNIVLGYSSLTFDWLIEKHRSQAVRAAAELIKEEVLRHLLCDRRSGG